MLMLVISSGHETIADFNVLNFFCIFCIFYNEYVLISSHRKPFSCNAVKLGIYQIWTLQGFLCEPTELREGVFPELRHCAPGPPSYSEFSIGEKRKRENKPSCPSLCQFFRPAHVNSIYEVFNN